MTELETMQRAKMYMDKLARGIDPISGQPLPGDTALNQVRLSRCFAYVSDVLGRVIANGGNVGTKTQPFAISPEQLARGIDPITDQPLPGDTALNQVRLSRCFAYVSDVLGRVIANGGNVGAKTQPFAISPEQLARVQLSREPVTVSWLVESLAGAVNDPRMRRLSATVITNWLLGQGFLEKRTTPDGKNNRVPTPSGQAIGLTSETRQGREGEYQMVFYDLNAQRFVLDHLMEMLQ